MSYDGFFYLKSKIMMIKVYKIVVNYCFFYIMRMCKWKREGFFLEKIPFDSLMLKNLVLLVKCILVYSFYRIYKEYGYISKWKTGMIGAYIYLFASLLDILITVLKEQSIRATGELWVSSFELVGLLLILIGSYQLAKEWIEIGNVDYLTETYTKRYIEKWLKQEIEKCRKTSGTFSVLFIDVNNFKEINDQFGHEQGNYVLIELAKILKKSVRKRDVVGRYGGDEFIIILEDADYEKALRVFERSRYQLSLSAISDTYGISFSGGVANYPDDGDNIQNISEIADKRMYEDKRKNKR